MPGRRPAPPRYTQLRTATRGEPDRSTGSQTITVEQDDADGDDRGEGSSTGGNVVGVLKLRGAHAEPRQRVTWTDETVDNELLNRKKSKICCIFHKAKPKNFEDPFAESSSSSSDDGSDDSDDDSESDHAGPEGETDENTGTARRHRKQKYKHEHGEGCTHASSSRILPNAYEHQPSYGAKKNKGKAKKSKAKASGSSTVTVTQEQRHAQEEPGEPCNPVS